MTPKLRLLLVVFAVVLPLDQLTKLWVVTNVHPFDPIVVVEGFFRITYARNPGAALGLFRGTPVLVFIALTGVALLLITSFYRRIEPEDRISVVALGMILGGAMGNLLDRLFRGGEVVDFLQFDLGLFVFPDFNVADSAIVIGIALLLRDLVLPHAGRVRTEDGEA